MDGVMKHCWLHATCGKLSDAYKLFEGLRSLKVGVDHMALHEGMFIHAGIMDQGIQNDLYTIMLWLSFTLNMENRGCLVIVNVGVYWMHVMTQRWYLDMLNMNMMRKIDLLWAYANSWYVATIEEVLNQVYQTKDSWLAIVLHKKGWGRIVIFFLSILYFVAHMHLKTNGKICSFLNYTWERFNTS